MKAKEIKCVMGKKGLKVHCQSVHCDVWTKEILSRGCKPTSSKFSQLGALGGNRKDSCIKGF